MCYKTNSPEVFLDPSFKYIRSIVAQHAGKSPVHLWKKNCLVNTGSIFKGDKFHRTVLLC